jgi:hypothetical protein
MKLTFLNKQAGQSRRIVLKSLLAAVFAGGALLGCGGGNDAPPPARQAGTRAGTRRRNCIRNRLAV